MFVDISDFVFVLGVWFQVFGDVNYLIVVEIKAWNGIVGFRFCWFFFNGNGNIVFIKFYYVIVFRVSYLIGENYFVCRVIVFVEQFFQFGIVENIIFQDQCCWVVINEGFVQDKSLCQFVGFVLWDVGEIIF